MIAIELFLEINGYRLAASDEETLATILALAAGEMEEDVLALWLRDQSEVLDT